MVLYVDSFNLDYSKFRLKNPYPLPENVAWRIIAELSEELCCTCGVLQPRYPHFPKKDILGTKLTPFFLFFFFS